MSKTAIVTGASRGIGAAIALRLAKEGFQVAINCVNEELASTEGAGVAAACQKLGAQARCYVWNVADFDACGEAVKKIREEMGSIDVLVNNAGITRDGLIARMGEDAFDAVISVNLKGVFNMCRHVSGVMMRQKSGRIINISSVSGLYGNPGQANYAASKAGIVGLTMTTAKELGPRGITSNAIAPGFVNTAMTEVLPENVKAEMLKAVPLGRMAQPEEIAGVAAFLASEDAAYINGQVIAVDGGMMM